MKRCTGCNEAKPRDAFYTRKGDKPTSRCKQCMTTAANEWRAKNLDRAAAAQRAMRARWRSENPRWWLAQHLRTAYGLTVTEYEAMTERQGSACAICGQQVVPLVVDHRHEDGYVRGLLCRPCNSAIGMLGDDSDRVLRAAAYLEGEL